MKDVGNPIDGLIISAVKEAEKLANDIVEVLTDDWDQTMVVVKKERLERIQLSLRAMAHLVETLREKNIDLVEDVKQATVKFDQARGRA